jgi:hypothetical protein
MPVHVSSAQQHRRRKHSQIIDISDESEAQRPNLAGGGGTAEAKRQCVENTAAAPTQIMPAAANANDDGSPASCGERRQTTIALRLRGGGPTVDSGVTTRRTRAAAAALRSGGTPTTNKARPAPPPTRPQSSARPAGGGNSSGSLSSSGGGASDNDSGVNVNERAPLLLGTPRSAQSNRHVDAAAAAPAPIIPPSAPRMPTADSKPAIAAKAGTVTPSAAAASGSAGGGFMDSSAASVAAGGGPSSRMQDQQAAVEAPAPGGGPARPDPNARPTNNDNNANEGGGGDGGGDNGSNSVEERPATLAVLNIRCPVPPPVPPPPPQRPPSQQQPPPTQQRKMPRDGPIVKVLVPTSGGEHAVTERELGRCIVQATGIGIVPPTADEGGWGWREGGLGYDPYAQYNPSGGADGNAEPPLAGLFRARDGLFLPLSYVLANALALQGELLSITRPVYRPRPPPPPPPIWPYVAGGLFVASIMARYGIDWDWFFDVTLYSAELAIRFLINLPFQLFNVLVEIPLREAYRHGPSFIGWEGQPLPRICSQVTFHGDEAFWSRNMQECEKIYAAKEAAAMHIRKPLLYIAVAAGLFFAAQSLVRTNAIRRQYRPDRNMYDVYNALNTLLRQVNRAGGGTGMPRR